MTPVNIFWHHFVSIMSTSVALFWVFCNFSDEAEGAHEHDEYREGEIKPPRWKEHHGLRHILNIGACPQDFNFPLCKSFVGHSLSSDSDQDNSILNPNPCQKLFCPVYRDSIFGGCLFLWILNCSLSSFMGFRKAACTSLWVPPSFSETAFVLFLGFLFFFLSIFMGTVYTSAASISAWWGLYWVFGKRKV